MQGITNLQDEDTSLNDEELALTKLATMKETGRKGERGSAER